MIRTCKSTEGIGNTNILRLLIRQYQHPHTQLVGYLLGRVIIGLREIRPIWKLAQDLIGRVFHRKTITGVVSEAVHTWTDCGKGLV